MAPRKSGRSIISHLAFVRHCLSEEFARGWARTQPGLRDAISRMQSQTDSKGCSWRAYRQLHTAVRTRHPALVLECGAGITSAVIGHALCLNTQDGKPGRAISLEQHESYFGQIRTALPPELGQFVQIIHSEVAEENCGGWTGLYYVAGEGLAPDFVFVDGPTYPKRRERAFNADFLRVSRGSGCKVFGLLDGRPATLKALRELISDLVVLPSRGPLHAFLASSSNV